MPRVHILPLLPEGPDPGDGGIRRVIVGQHQTLPEFGWEIVNAPGDADVIACHVEIPPAYLRLYPDTPVVVHNHGLYWTDGDLQWEPWSYKVNDRALDAIRNADIVTAVSQWTAQAIRRGSMRDVRVVYHGVDLDEWAPLPMSERRAYVLWNKTRVDPVCTTEPLDAVARLLPDVRFVSTFGQQAQNVTLTGRVAYEEGKEMVRRAGVYLATTRETFGIGTLEALAAGVPVVGYDFGGQSEIIKHGVDGWLARPGDVSGLAAGIRWALTNRDTIAAAARAKAEQFPVRRSGEAYAAIYDEALAAARERQQGPRVSVIVPAYQMGDYLDDTLTSIAAQDDPDWECIVVNDASPDARDHEIAQRWAAQDARFREIVLPSNGYLAHARNVGIANARGRYVLPVDADDQIAPGTVRMLADALDNDRALHIAYGNVFFVGADGRTPMIYAGHEREPGHSGWPVEFRLDQMLQRPGQLLPYASMFRRDIWRLTGGYRERSRSSEDQDFWLRTTSYGFRARMVTEAVTLIYRVRPGSMSSAQGEGWEEHRLWFPWSTQLRLTPAAAYREDAPPEAIPMPSHDPSVVAVVIPVGPAHVSVAIDAVDSVDAQTFRDWECIVVNDSGRELNLLPSWVRVVEIRESDDPEDAAMGLPGVVERAGNALPMAGTHPAKFGGVAAARNAGIRHSRAPLFIPLDADDYLQPRALELLLRNYRSGTEPAIIYSDFWEDPHEVGRFTVWRTPDYDPRSFVSKGLGRAVTALTPRAAWEAVGGYRTDIAWEDWAFAIECASIGVCERRIALPLFTYRKHTGSRRVANLADFDESKRSIMETVWNKAQGGELMACSRCGSGAATTEMNFLRSNGSPPEGSVLLRYVGNISGPASFRSKSNPNITYRFGTVRPEGYVLEADAPGMVASGHFQRVNIPQEVHEAMTPEPVLVAARTPASVVGEAAPSGASSLSPWAPLATDVASDVAPSPAVADAQPDASAFASPMSPPVATMEREPESDPAPAPAPEDEEPGAAIRQTEQGRTLAQRNSREALDKMARDLGIANPGELRSKAEVAEAIIIKRSIG